MDDWIVYGLIRDYLENLRLMLERCRQQQIALNSKKCIFYAPFFDVAGSHCLQVRIGGRPCEYSAHFELTTTNECEYA